MAKRDLPARAAKRLSGVESRKGKGRARTRAGGLKIIDDPKTDERRLAHQLKTMGLYAAHTLGDGNCLFRALSDQLYGTPNHHATVRADTCTYLASNEARYKAFVDTDEDDSWEGHLREMRRNGTYGGHMELSAFAHLHRRPIKVIQPGLVYVIGHEDESPGALKRRAESQRERSLRRAGAGAGVGVKGKGREADENDQAEREDEAAEEEEHTGDTTEEEFGEDSPLYIIYHQWEHYSSVRNIDGPHVGPPRIRERKVSPSDSPASSQETDSREDSVATDEIDLLRKSLPSAPSSRFSDRQLSELVSKHGSWEKTLEVLIDRPDSDPDVAMLDPPPTGPPATARPAPAGEGAKRKAASVSPIRIRVRKPPGGGGGGHDVVVGPGPRDSSPATSSSTATDSNAQSSSHSGSAPPFLPSATLAAPSEAAARRRMHHLVATHFVSESSAGSDRPSSSSPSSKPNSRSRSPEASASPDEGVGRRLRRRPDDGSGVASGASSPSEALVADEEPEEGEEEDEEEEEDEDEERHVNTVSADLDASNERPTRLRHRLLTSSSPPPVPVPPSSSSPPPPSRPSSTTMMVMGGGSRRGRRAENKGRKRDAAAARRRTALGVDVGVGRSVSVGHEASALFKELHV